MTGPTAATRDRRLTFVPTADHAPAMRPGDLTVVLDSAWTPAPGGRSDVVPVRPAFAAALEGHDLFGEALELVDAWGIAAGATDLLVVEGVTYWFRLRESLWHWVHERLLWRYALAAIEADGPYDAVSVPWDEPALIDVVRALGRTLAIAGSPPAEGAGRRAAPADATSRPASGYVPASARRALRRLLPKRPSATTIERRRRETLLDARFERLRALRDPRVVVLTLPSSYQRIGGADDGRPRDPNLGSVIPALGAAGMESVVVGWGMSRQADGDWAAVEADDRLLPSWYLQARWARPEDDARAQAAIGAIRARLDAAPAVPFALDGLDLTTAFTDVLWTTVSRVANGDVHELARVERFIAELLPAALLMTQEGHRTSWLRAGAAARVPTFALQHGVLYPAHAGYPDRRDDRLVLATCTFVFGDFERRVLESLGYRPAEVAVSGSPRLDLTTTGGAHGDPAEGRAAGRAAVRAELGVAEGDRLLVVSTVHTPFVRRSHLVHMLERCLGGPLSGIHIVFKQHPGERDDGPYRALLEGLARAGGYEAPPMTVVKDIDLYRLLGAADAHLGQHSTVLTDAVMAGTPNLMAQVEPGGDLIGYVPAGVVQSIGSVAHLRTAMRDPRPPDRDVRRAFIDDHFRRGDASARIAAAIASAIDRPGATAAPAAVPAIPAGSA